MRALVLVPREDYPEPWRWAFEPQQRALLAHGFEVETRPWDETSYPAGFDAVLPLVAWGYNRHYQLWLDLLDRAEAEHWPLVNAAATLRWNSDKIYLEELEASGIRSVPTISAEALCAGDLAGARKQFGTGRLVVKPPVSASADGTYLLDPESPLPSELEGRRAMIQPFEPAITQSGEWSLMIFGGRLSHAIVKLPKSGDFRVQPQFGGQDRLADPPEGALDLALAALDAAPGSVTYARVDIVRRRDNELAIIELELIEPALFLDRDNNAPQAFAAAVRSSISLPRGR